MRLVVLPGVLRPPSDCWLLTEAIRDHRLAHGAAVLDVCTGSGALAIFAALEGAVQVSAVDVSRRAVVNARINAILNRVRIRAVRGDLFAPVAGRRFDLIVSNPPYLPGEGVKLPRRGPARAWEGGLDGRLVLDRLCAEAPAHLKPRGTLVLVQSSLTGEQETLDRLAAAGLQPSVIARRRGPLGPLAASRVEFLERRGLLKAGEREEELIVVVAQRPS